jgi:hypothetical protein
VAVLALTSRLFWTGSAAALEGWVVFANAGKVYRCAVGARVEQLCEGDAAHACWSADGRRVFYITWRGKLWVMNNDGSERRFLRNGRNTNHCPIAAYRPNPRYVLYVERKHFYKIGLDGQKTLVYAGERPYSGEIAISTDGTRMVGRSKNHLYRIDVGGASRQYSVKCSASLSPDGTLMTRNTMSHVGLEIHRWDSSRKSGLHAQRGTMWDNHRFAVNSNEYITFNYDGTRNSVGVVRLSDNEIFPIGEVKSYSYIDLWMGALP